MISYDFSGSETCHEFELGVLGLGLQTRARDQAKHDA